MIVKVAELKVKKSADYNNSVIKALEKDGFIVILEVEGITESHYSIAIKRDMWWRDTDANSEDTDSN